MGFPVVIVTTAFAQLFRVTGLVSYVHIAHNVFKDKPSEYYPIPIFGPILNATLLGNMGGIFSKGLEDYVKNGIPWSFQTGLFCASFYHFYVNDKTGWIGITLRQYVPSSKYHLDDATFALLFVSAFQHIVAILQLP